MEEALYSLHDGKLLVNGTYMTEVHITALVFGDTTCKTARVSYYGSELNGPYRSPAPPRTVLHGTLGASERGFSAAPPR